MPSISVAIEKKALTLSAAARIHLAEKLLASVDAFASRELEQAWDAEIGRRVNEIRKGEAIGIPAGEVFAEARKALNETRRLSSARRKRAD